MSKYGNLLFSTGTPQSQPLRSAVAKQEVNSAGGFVFSLDKFKRLERFLILGSDSNTYYSSAHKLTKENAACVTECWTEDFARTQRTIYTISIEGRAAKNSPAIFAVALGCINPNINARKAAFEVMPKVCRTSTHLFEFVSICDDLGKGWGRGMKNAVAGWYNTKTDEQLAYQLIKYRQREGYTHERLIRLSHPKQELPTAARRDMYDWLRGRGMAKDGTGTEVGRLQALPAQVRAHIQAMKQEDNEHDIKNIVSLVNEFKLPWEALPTWANTKPAVWKSMFANNFPLTAMLRNLGNMTRLGVFDNEREENYALGVQHMLTYEALLRNARIHPFNILNASKTYGEGHGFRGSNSWTPNRTIQNALEVGFYKSFKFIEPTNQRIMLALDVSGSMTGATLMNSALSAREASAAMAMATLAVEENATVVGFTSLHAHNSGMDISPLEIRRGMTLDQVTSYTDGLPFSGTDCSLPMLYAMENHIAIDAFIIYTDSETWAGNIHASEALRRYRAESGIDAKLIVVGMTSTGFTIADPNDAGMLDIVGFDASAPAVIADFLRGSRLLLEDHTRAIVDVDE